jgi:mannose/cellobiose epimerase-like protein (N-acyl-D-glucosamine 2-epimerase family)
MHEDSLPTIQTKFADKVAQLSHWLNAKALPLWLSNGFDPAAGAFYERIGRDGNPMTADLRRARVQPRQIYCFAAAGMRGWQGKWRPAVLSSLKWFEDSYRRPDGLFGNLANASGEMVDDSFDLYNHAFAIFGYSYIARAFPERATKMEKKAVALLDLLNGSYKHPMAGFEESVSRSLPLCSNPHMHLFESCLSWEEIADQPERWAALGDEIAELALSRFINARTGALSEFFDAAWSPMPGDKGRVVEPGHQFEWAWLLARWGELRGRDDAMAAAGKLFDIGVRHGVDAARKVSIMAINDDFSVRDPIARLWPQTEWIKAACILARMAPVDDRDAYLKSAVAACDALLAFFDDTAAGLWHDKIAPNGTVVVEPAPASTFYHIACAIFEAEDTMAGFAMEDLSPIAHRHVESVGAAM